MEAKRETLRVAKVALVDAKSARPFDNAAVAKAEEAVKVAQAAVDETPEVKADKPVAAPAAKHDAPVSGKHDAHKNLLEKSAALAKLVGLDVPTHQAEIAAAEEAVRIAEREVRSETAQ